MTSEDCRHCALELREKVGEQQTEIVRLQEQLVAERDAREAERTAQDAERDLSREHLSVWQKTHNAWVDRFNDLSSKLMTQARWDIEHRALMDRVEVIEKRHTSEGGRASAYQAVWLVVAVIVGWMLNAALHLLK